MIYVPDPCKLLLLNVLFSICWIDGQKFRIPWGALLGDRYPVFKNWISARSDRIMPADINHIIFFK